MCSDGSGFKLLKREEKGRDNAIDREKREVKYRRGSGVSEEKYY